MLGTDKERHLIPGSLLTPSRPAKAAQVLLGDATLSTEGLPMSAENRDFLYCVCKSILEALKLFNGGAIGELIRQIKNVSRKERVNGECDVCLIFEVGGAENTVLV